MLGILIFLFILLIIVIIYALSGEYEDPARKAGREAEHYATGIIQQAINDDDVLLTNVEVEYNGQRTELDNVIINKYGVFIIEVKYYSGDLTGNEDDYEWVKQHESHGGNIYEKSVKNPIKQVKRQVYILSRVFNYFGVRAWVDGYVYMIENNSPVDSEYILNNTDEIRRVIHSRSKHTLTKETISHIEKILQIE